MLHSNCNCEVSERTIKNIYVFANGEKYSGQKVVLSQNRWHHILNDITAKLNPNFGKVEKLYTTTSGLTVYSFTDLNNYAVYVASNRARRFLCVKGGYTIETIPPQEYFEHYLTSQLQRLNKSKKLVYVRRDLLVIYVFRNGECGQSFKIVLTSDDLSSWSHILSYVALILDVPERCIKSLYSVKGNKICGPWELQHGASYVAVGYNQSFRKGCYHAQQKSTEIITTGIPVVPKDKNLICNHLGKRKKKPMFTWNHYDQYNCVDTSPRKSRKKSRNGSKKSKRNRSRSKKSERKSSCGSNISKPNNCLANTTDTENTKNTENTTEKKNKRVVVHMRIQNIASNVMLTRSSGDSSPTRGRNKCQLGNNNSESSSSKASSDCCDCTANCCSVSTNTNQQTNKYSGKPTPDSSDSDIPNTQEKKKTKRNLKWKHVKNEPISCLNNDERVSVHIRGGQAIISGGSSTNTVKKSLDNIFGQKKRRKYSEENYEPRKSIMDSIRNKISRSEKNSGWNCGTEGWDNKVYKIAKPAKDKYRSSCCPNSCSEPKPKYNTILKTTRRNSNSRMRNRNCGSPCKEAPPCREPATCSSKKWKTFFKNMSTFFFDSSSSYDSMKGKSRPKKKSFNNGTDSEDSSARVKCLHNQSSCTICRIQQERKKIIRRYK